MTNPLARSSRPDLSLVALCSRRRLAVRPTSCEVERYFSRAGYLLSPLRSRLDPALVRDILFLSANMDLLEPAYPFVTKLLARRQKRELAREACTRNHAHAFSA